MPLKRVTDTPAKVFARLKAKVQQQNSEEHKDHAMAKPLGRGLFYTNIQQPPDDYATSEDQDAHVLTLSPPKSISTNSAPGDHQRRSRLDRNGARKPDLVHS